MVAMLRYVGILIAPALLFALASCCDLMDNRARPMEYPKDAVIVNDINQAFFADGLIKPAYIQIRSIDGTVDLSGSVETEAEKDRAADLAHKVNGVRPVNNYITAHTAL
jgi:osmotically-inducible protein OsmY